MVKINPFSLGEMNISPIVAYFNNVAIQVFTYNINFDRFLVTEIYWVSDKEYIETRQESRALSSQSRRALDFSELEERSKENNFPYHLVLGTSREKVGAILQERGISVRSAQVCDPFLINLFSSN